MLQKILTLEATDSWVSKQRAEGLRIGFTCGAFDVLHAGHVDLLERAKGLCDRLLVAVNSDESVRQYKSPFRPVIPEAQRMQVVAGLGCVDVVVRLDEERPLGLIERWRPDLYIKGGDYTGLRSGTTVESYGGKVVLLPFATEQSTTAIMERIAALHAHRGPADLPKRQVRGIVLLDRDGTLIRNVPYLHDPAKVELLPGVTQGLKRLQEAGFRLVIVTNQQGIGLGYFTIEDFFEVNLAIFRQLSAQGIKIDRVYWCPHSVADDCLCRKPGTALLERALKEYEMAAQDCWMLGDSAADVAAGEAAGCHALLIDPDPRTAAPHSIAEAADIILTPDCAPISNSRDD
ncbi:MAG: HAD-IIIA family hydrolase [Bryobacteraceae bacterium]